MINVKVKVLRFYLYTTTHGWMYILDKNYFQKGDEVTDGTNIYRITDTEPVISPEFKYSLPNSKSSNSEWLYGFHDEIKKYKDKILTKL